MRGTVQQNNVREERIIVSIENKSDNDHSPQYIDKSVVRVARANSRVLCVMAKSRRRSQMFEVLVNLVPIIMLVPMFNLFDAREHEENDASDSFNIFYVREAYVKFL